MGKPKIDPTKQEIAAACALIRLGWDKGEKHRRRYAPVGQSSGDFSRTRVHWYPPVIATAELTAAMGR